MMSMICKLLFVCPILRVVLCPGDAPGPMQPSINPMHHEVILCVFDLFLVNYNPRCLHIFLGLALLSGIARAIDCNICLLISQYACITSYCNCALFGPLRGSPRQEDLQTFFSPIP